MHAERAVSNRPGSALLLPAIQCLAVPLTSLTRSAIIKYSIEYKSRRDSTPPR